MKVAVDHSRMMRVNVWECRFEGDYPGVGATGCVRFFAKPLRQKWKAGCSSAVDGLHQGFLASSLIICTTRKGSGVTLAWVTLECVASGDAVMS